MNIQRHRRFNVNTFPRNIKTFDDEDRRIDQDERLAEIDNFSRRGSACTQRSALRTAKTDDGKLLESINAILAGMLDDE
jgi:hypothetical protein